MDTIRGAGWICNHPARHPEDWPVFIPCQDCRREPSGYHRDWTPLMPTIARLLRYSFKDINGFYELTVQEQTIVASPERFADLKTWVGVTLTKTGDLP